MGNTLALTPGRRNGDPSGRNVVRAERRFLEFLVDGSHLGVFLGPHLGLADTTTEYVPVLATNWPSGVAVDDVRRLIGAMPSPGLNGRTALYVCAECGDVSCGGVTVNVRIEGDEVAWYDFGYQNDYEPFDAAEAVFSEVGPFRFDRTAYTALLEGFLTDPRSTGPAGSV